MNGIDLAFPFNERNDDGTHFFAHDGLTKRELFAAMAMQGLLASDAPDDFVARWAVSAADALLTALNAEPQS